MVSAQPSCANPRIFRSRRPYPNHTDPPSPSKLLHKFPPTLSGDTTNVSPPHYAPPEQSTSQPYTLGTRHLISSPLSHSLHPSRKTLCTPPFLIFSKPLTSRLHPSLSNLSCFTELTETQKFPPGWFLLPPYLIPKDWTICARSPRWVHLSLPPTEWKAPPHLNRQQESPFLPVKRNLIKSPEPSRTHAPTLLFPLADSSRPFSNFTGIQRSNPPPFFFPPSPASPLATH